MPKQLIFIFIITSIPGYGQNTQHPYSILLNYGLTSTFHRNAPIPTQPCFEGCNPTKQSPRLANSFLIGIARRFKLHEVSFSSGYAALRFYEEGLASDGGSGLNSYQLIENFSLISTQLEHLVMLHEFQRTTLFAGYGLITELNTFHRYLQKINFSYKARFGMDFYLSENITMAFSACYRGALRRYNIEAPGGLTAYLPYGIGLEVTIKKVI